MLTPIQIQTIALELNLKQHQVENTIELFEQDATVPFIARYRKEVTDNLDEKQIINIQELMTKLITLENRRQTILKTIEGQGKLTDELKKQINEAKTLTELEDLYLPYKPKRRTKAQIAREKGLEPLAKLIYKQKDESNPEEEAKAYVNEKVKDIEEALQGSRDIIAEWINEDKEIRFEIRKLFEQDATIKSKVWQSKKEEAAKYQDYFEYEEDLDKCPSHRFLAMLRGDNELFLCVTIGPKQSKAISLLNDLVLKGDNPSSYQVQEASEDCYKRLLEPSIENEFRKIYKEKADTQAIEVFAQNLRQLLLAAPLGQKRVLALDPGFRTGCKVVCLDEQGGLLHHDVIYPTPPRNEQAESAKTILKLVNKYKIQAISIGNGTASRETETFVRNIPFDNQVNVFVVNEDGASIYSASEAGREEFPDHDATVRGSISIGRRLMDPLAELVKIDPKSVGVGQYQHDVDQLKLHRSLDAVVMSCVNSVGVNINTASKHLLTYVSGLGPQLAQNVVEYRSKNGAFKTRKEIKKVTRLGAKAFEQCAGFLRIENAKNCLDNSGVHPESYSVVEKIAKDLDCKVCELMEDGALRNQINIQDYITDKIGLPTLEDIMKELEKPGRDPREQIEIFQFAEDIHSMDDLNEGMVLPGIVTNITNFGAFVDIGIKQDGLVHISEMADKFVSDPNDIVKLQQKVKVRVKEVDIERGRIQLSMKWLEE